MITINIQNLPPKEDSYRRVNAVKAYRQMTDCSLKDAVDFLNKVDNGEVNSFVIEKDINNSFFSNCQFSFSTGGYSIVVNGSIYITIKQLAEKAISNNRIDYAAILVETLQKIKECDRM